MYDDLHAICAIIGVVVAMLNTTTNATILVAFYKMPKKARNSTSNILLANQACADLSLIFPSLLHSLSMYYWIVDGNFDVNLSSIIYVVSFFTGPACIMTLVLTIAYGAYVISRPQVNVSKCKVICSVCGSWVVPSILAVLIKMLVVDSPDRIQSEYRFIVSYFISVIVIIVLLTIFLVVSCRTQPSFRCRALLKSSLSSPYVEVDGVVGVGHQTQKRLLTSMFLRTSSLVTTHVPHIVLSLILLHGDIMNELLYHVANWTSLSYLVYTFYPVLNSLITIFLVDDFHVARKWVTLGMCPFKCEKEEECEGKEVCSVVISDV